MAYRNGNEGCLEGYECPRCGQHQKLYVRMITRIELFDDGTGDYTDPEFDDKSEATCSQCKFNAKLARFRLAMASSVLGRLGMVHQRNSLRTEVRTHG